MAASVTTVQSLPASSPLTHPGPAPFDRLVLAGEGVEPTSFGDDASTTVVADGALFIQLLRRARPALAVLVQPPATSLEIQAVLAERRQRRELRVVLVNPPEQVTERLAALRHGFDEALARGTDPRELLGRLSLLADQAHAAQLDARITITDDVILDPQARELRIRGRGIHLRPRESALLEVLAREPGRTFSREQLLHAVASETVHRDLRTIDVHIRWLRAKLDFGPRTSARLITVRGLGYRLEANPPRRRRRV